MKAKKLTKRQALPMMAAAARQAGGKPNLSQVAREVGYSAQTVRRWWGHHEREILTEAGLVDPAEGDLIVLDGQPMPVEDLAPLDFYRLQVRRLSGALEEAIQGHQLNGAAGLAKQLHEARKQLDAHRPEDVGPLELEEEEYRARLVLAFRDAPSSHIEELLRVYQDRLGVALLVPRPDGGPSMVLTDDGWVAEGPPVAWSDDLARR